MAAINLRLVSGALLLLGAMAAAPATPPSQHFMFVSNLGRSHMVPYLEVLQPLAERGHRVSVVTDKAAATWLASSYPSFELQFVPGAIDERIQQLKHSDSGIVQQMLDPNRRGFALILQHLTIPTYPIMSAFLRGVFNSSRPDLIICDIMVDACPDMADTLAMPYAVSVSSIPPGVSGAPYVNSWFSPYLHTSTLQLTLWQRFVTSFVVPAQIMASMQNPTRRLDKVKQECGVVAPKGPPAARHAHALKLVNTFIGFESPRPLHPLVHVIGPIRSHVNSSMPAAIQGWLDQLAANISSSGSSMHGGGGSSQPRVIYVAFGTHVDLPSSVLQHLSDALLAVLEAGYADGVVWAVSNIRRDKFPAAIEHHPRVLLLPFAPQRALLAHPCVSLFVSHGGAESSHEAMYEGVPMLVVSFFGDQPMNGAKLREAGMAEMVRQHLLTADTARHLLLHMLSPVTADPYRAAARKMQALVRALDRTNTAAAANMLEFFAQYGWSHLVLAGSKMPWHKANNADLYAAVGAVALLVLASAGLALQLLARMLSRKAGSRAPAGVPAAGQLGGKGECGAGVAAALRVQGVSSSKPSCVAQASYDIKAKVA